MMKKRTSVLVVSRSSRERLSLRALLSAVPQIEIVVDGVDDGSSALRLVTERHPALVLLDASLPDDEAWSVLRRIKAGQSPTRCLVLADNVSQQQAAREAGADAVLVKGGPAAQLVATMERLLAQQIDAPRTTSENGNEQSR